MLILTHECANENEFDTYLLDQMFPVRPVICFGRSAAASPKVGKEQAVRHWWEDFWEACGSQAHLGEFLRRLTHSSRGQMHACTFKFSYLNFFENKFLFGHIKTCAPRHSLVRHPSEDVAVHFMTDERWEKDTLFIVFEEDFRFEPDAQTTASASGPGSAGSSEPAAGEPALRRRPMAPVQCVLLDYGNKEPLCIQGIVLIQFSRTFRDLNRVATAKFGKQFLSQALVESIISLMDVAASSCRFTCFRVASSYPKDQWLHSC